jgi:hypothetical protein
LVFQEWVEHHRLYLIWLLAEVVVAEHVSAAAAEQEDFEQAY